MARYYYERYSIIFYWHPTSGGLEPTYIWFGDYYNNLNLLNKIGLQSDLMTIEISYLGRVPPDKKSIYSYVYFVYNASYPAAGGTHYLNYTGQMSLLRKYNFDDFIPANTCVFRMAESSFLEEWVTTRDSIVHEGKSITEISPVAEYTVPSSTMLISKFPYKGAYKDTVIAEDETYPDNGIQGDYWYVKTGKAFPELTIKIDNQLKTSEAGWVKIDGQLKEIEKIWTKVDGQLKEV